MTDDSSRRVYLRLPRFSEERFRPYALAMGQANLAWNDLHEHMGRFFALILDTVGDSRKQGLAVWHSMNSDRAKREALIAAVKSLPALQKSPGVAGDILFMCERVNSLEEARNNIVHGPLILSLTLDDFKDLPSRAEATRRASVLPHDVGGNTRAMKMVGKDVLREFRGVRDKATALRNYVAAMDDSLNSEKPWPKRPPGLGKDSPKTRPQGLRP